MPVITFEGPVIENLEVKRKLVQKLTDAAVETFEKIPREAFIVLIKENPPTNVGSGGTLLIDRSKP
ncbi:conserved domain protein [Candidatus Vecturithrix granuli]|uniref:Conserved domain protein n=1 Tax=Vecturithrix granuli TaxID=1499967 RepID=A0A081C7A4_VECG1|nr:conserved domain protein [Candidatus Vecturithrix granuli]